MLQRIALLGLALAVPSLAAAQPSAFAERGKVIAEGRQIKIFGLPTLNNNGEFKFFDVIIELAIGGAGKPNARASVVSTATQIEPSPIEFAAGVYGDPLTLCSVVVSDAQAGRRLIAINCTDRSAPSRTTGVQLFTGPISGHPLQDVLEAAGIDTIAGAAAFSWGRVNGTTGGGVSCVDSGVVGAVQVGDTLFLSEYGSDSGLNCGVALAREVVP